MNSLCPNIETPDYISWRSISTLRATVRPLMFASLPADRTCTRGICFVDFNRSGQFVVKLFNNSAIGGGGNALRLPVRGPWAKMLINFRPWKSAFNQLEASQPQRASCAETNCAGTTMRSEAQCPLSAIHPHSLLQRAL